MISKVCLKRVGARFSIAAAVALYAPAPFAAAQSAEAPAAQAASASRPTLDYEFFRTRVEPIFLKKRSADHARCYVCHQTTHHTGFGPFRLEQLSPGSSFWTEEQSRRNFQVVSKLVVPGAPLKSLILIHPLGREGGGDSENHPGGTQFASKDDPDWQTIAEWVRGQKASGSSGP